MPAQPILIRACDNSRIASTIAAAIAREYSTLTVTKVVTEHPRHNVFVARRDGRRLTNEWVQALVAFASGAAAAAASFFDDHPQPAPGIDGCEFCRPAAGDPFTSRPRGEAWTCPYCRTVYSGKEND